MNKAYDDLVFKLKEHFGHSDFKSKLQREAIEAILKSKFNCILTQCVLKWEYKRNF